MTTCKHTCVKYGPKLKMHTQETHRDTHPTVHPPTPRLPVGDVMTNSCTTCWCRTRSIRLVDTALYHVLPQTYLNGTSNCQRRDCFWQKHSLIVGLNVLSFMEEKYCSQYSEVNPGPSQFIQSKIWKRVNVFYVKFAFVSLYTSVHSLYFLKRKASTWKKIRVS